jgi:hypothetical protein
MGGELRPMKIYPANRWQLFPGPHYYISHKGKKKNMSVEYLEKLKLVDSEIPIAR